MNSNDGFNDHYDGGMTVQLSSSAGASNWPVVASGFMNANVDTTGSDDGDSYPQIGELWTLHAYSISATSFKFKARMETKWGDDGGGYHNDFPTLVSFIGYDS